MKITTEITLDIDMKRWAEIAHSDGLLASEVRKDIRHDMRRVVVQNYKAAGLLLPRPQQDDDRQTYRGTA